MSKPHPRERNKETKGNTSAVLGEKQSIVVLCFLTLTGAFLRLYQLGFHCYWTEEAYTGSMVQKTFAGIVISSITTDVNPPLYYLAAHLSMIVFGFTAVAIRYPSAFFGVLLIPAMYVLGREYRDEITGLFCAGITAVLYPMVYYSQYGRAYEMSWFFFVLTLILYIRIRDGKNRHKNMLVFGILAAITLWTQLFTLIPIGLMIIDLVLSYRLKMAGSVLITGILCSPLVIIPMTLLQTRIVSESGVDFGDPIAYQIITTPQEFFSLAFPVIIPLITIGWIWDNQKIKNRLMVLALATLVIGIACSFVTPMFPRYYTTAAFIFILFASVACTKIVNAVAVKPYQVVLIILAIIALLVYIEYPAYLLYYFNQKFC
jgi:mannosyltransferase